MDELTACVVDVLSLRLMYEICFGGSVVYLVLALILVRLDLVGVYLILRYEDDTLYISALCRHRISNLCNIYFTLGDNKLNSTSSNILI